MIFMIKKRLALNRVIGKVQIWKIFFMLLEESVFSGFSLLFLRGNQSIQFVFFIYFIFFPWKGFDILYSHVVLAENKDFFFL